MTDLRSDETFAPYYSLLSYDGKHLLENVFLIQFEFPLFQAAIVACSDLKFRMGKVSETLSNPSWLELVQECNKHGVDLTARHM